MGATIGAAIVGGWMASQSAGKSRRSAEKAAKSQLQEEQRQFGIVQEQQRPFREAGTRALASLESMMGIQENPYKVGSPEYEAFENRKRYDITETPGYQFRLEEGMGALEAGQAGRRLGGRAAKEALRYGQEYASGEYGKEFGRLSQIAGFGPQAVGQTIAAKPSTAAYGDIGRAGMAEAEAQSDITQQTLSNLMTWQQYNQPQTRTITGTMGGQ